MVKRNVVWTGTAVRQRTEILKYWTIRNDLPRYAKKLLKLIDNRLKIIRKFPEAFKATIYPETRISAMGHFSILYKVTETQIIVTSFWDNRQDPEKLLVIISD